MKEDILRVDILRAYGLTAPVIYGFINYSNEMVLTTNEYSYYVKYGAYIKVPTREVANTYRKVGEKYMLVKRVKKVYLGKRKDLLVFTDYSKYFHIFN